MGLCNDACSRDISGGYSDGVPPLPIPNREVKPDRADGTAHPRESRSPPFYKISLETRKRLGALLCLDGWGASAMGEERSAFGEKGFCRRGGGRFGMREQREAWILRFGSISRGEITFLVRYCALFGMSLSLYRFLL